jgi:hypothetical protein
MCYVCRREFCGYDDDDDPNEYACLPLHPSCGHLIGEECYEDHVVNAIQSENVALSERPIRCGSSWTPGCAWWLHFAFFWDNIERLRHILVERLPLLEHRLWLLHDKALEQALSRKQNFELWTFYFIRAVLVTLGCAFVLYAVPRLIFAFLHTLQIVAPRIWYSTEEQDMALSVLLPCIAIFIAKGRWTGVLKSLLHCLTGTH